MIIRHNLPAMNAGRQYNIVENKKAKHTEKLSSGYRINRAADDAAGLSISEKLRRQVRGLSKGVENAQDGISLCQVADGALNEVHDMMQRLEQLSVQAANGTNTYEDKQAIQKEITQLLAEIDRISNTTTFNEQRVFRGGVDAVGVSQPAAPAPSPEAPATPTAPTAPPIPVVSGEWKKYGDFEVKGGTFGKDFEFTSYPSGVLTVKSPTALAIRNANPAAKTGHCIKVETNINATVVLEGVNIEASSDNAAFSIADDSTGNVSVAFRGNNRLIGAWNRAGLEKNGANGTLAIWGDGSLLAVGPLNAAGIGGSRGKSASHITIHSGTVTAEGETGIGGGSNGSGSDITINGGTVTAVGGTNGAGIGGGMKGNGSGITINGGTVKATSEVYGAGIGGGLYGSGSQITINGGTVVADSTLHGAGIGGGSYGNGSGISITGGTVTATSGANGAGIGGGSGYDFAGDGSNISISGGTVTATGGQYGGAGIGGGYNKAGNHISITGGIVTATGGPDAQSIGNGKNNTTSAGNKIGTESYAPAGRGTTTIAVAGPAGALIIDDKTGEAKGTVPLKQDFAIPDYAAVTVDQNAVITVEKDVQLTNKGTLENNGTIDVYGKFTKIEGGKESDVEEGRGTLPGTGIVIYHHSGAAAGSEGTSFTGAEPLKNWWWIHSGAEPGIGLMLEIDAMNTAVLGLSGMDVTTDRGAANGINAVKGALASMCPTCAARSAHSKTA